MIPSSPEGVVAFRALPVALLAWSLAGCARWVPYPTEPTTKVLKLDGTPRARAAAFDAGTRVLARRGYVIHTSDRPAVAVTEVFEMDGVARSAPVNFIFARSPDEIVASESILLGQGRYENRPNARVQLSTTPDDARFQVYLCIANACPTNIKAWINASNAEAARDLDDHQGAWLRHIMKEWQAEFQQILKETDAPPKS